MKRSFHNIKKCYDGDFMLSDFKSYMIDTLVSRASIMSVDYGVFTAIRYDSRCKVKTLGLFKGHKNGKCIYNRLKLPRIMYNLRDYF